MNKPSAHRHEYLGAKVSPAGATPAGGGGRAPCAARPISRFAVLPVVAARGHPAHHRALRCGTDGYVVTPNAHHVVAVHEEPARLLPVYRGAGLSLCDSRILRALAKLEGLSLPLVTGSDLVAALLSTLNSPSQADLPRRLLVVGPSSAAAAALRAAYPYLTLNVMPAPDGLAKNAELRLAVARDCVGRPWDILLLCVGCPGSGTDRPSDRRAWAQNRGRALRRRGD